jgi:anaerobic C4-dicarboxylate transporter
MEILISSIIIGIVMFLILLPSMKAEIKRNKQKQVKLKEPKHAEFKIQRKDKIDIKTLDNDKKDE